MVVTVANGDLPVFMKNGRLMAGKFSSGNFSRPNGARNKKTLAIESSSKVKTKRMLRSNSSFSFNFKITPHEDLDFT